MYDIHPDEDVANYNTTCAHHFQRLKGFYNSAIQSGSSHDEAKKHAIRQETASFLKELPEDTPIQKAWHEAHMNLVDNFAANYNPLKEDVPTNSMAGGAIANKPMGLGGVRTHLVKREILRVLGKVRARNRTKVRY